MQNRTFFELWASISHKAGKSTRKFWATLKACLGLYSGVISPAQSPPDFETTGPQHGLWKSVFLNFQGCLCEYFIVTWTEHMTDWLYGAIAPERQGLGKYPLGDYPLGGYMSVHWSADCTKLLHWQETAAEDCIDWLNMWMWDWTGTYVSALVSKLYKIAALTRNSCWALHWLVEDVNVRLDRDICQCIKQLLITALIGLRCECETEQGYMSVH